MAFTQLPSFTKTVSMLPDNPALTPTQLKAQFDAAPSELLTYFNNLITALKQTTNGDSGAKNIGATTISGLTGNDIQTLLESLKSYAATGTSLIQKGATQTYTFTPGTTTDITVTFAKPFASAPTFVFSPSGDAVYNQWMTFTLYSVDANKAVIRCKNNSTNNSSQYTIFHWIATV